MRAFAEAPEAVTVMAEIGRDLAGFAIAEMAEETSYVVTVDVATQWRRRGLGRRIVEELEAKSQIVGARSIMLHVFTGNGAAVALYEAMGYQRTGVARGFYGRNLDGWVYQKKLGSRDSG